MFISKHENGYDKIQLYADTIFIRGKFKSICLNIQYHKLFLIKDLKYIYFFPHRHHGM